MVETLDRTLRSYTLTPRDPLVLGDGRPLERQQGELWPVPATLTAAVNAWASRDRSRRWPDAYMKSTTLRGPLLHNGDELLMPPPADARVRGECQDGADKWSRARLRPEGEHVLWPDSFPALSHLVEIPERTELDGAAIKLRPIEVPVTLEFSVAWALNQPVSFQAGEKGARQAGEKGARPRPLVQAEHRTHVGILSDTFTADPGVLFRSAGMRLQQGLSYAFTFEGPELNEGLVQLGGEGRLAHLQQRSSIFPAFPDALYKRHLKTGYLRIQLLTPALFSPRSPMLPGWLAGTVQGPLHEDGPVLRLIALTTDRYRAFSGWKTPHSMDSAGIPRAVRRLVPAGAVYWFGDETGRPFGAETLYALCKGLWLQPLDSPSASASHQGFGLCLPGFTPSEQVST